MIRHPPCHFLISPKIVSLLKHAIVYQDLPFVLCIPVSIFNLTLAPADIPDG